jgi:hypothetical protein
MHDDDLEDVFRRSLADHADDIEDSGGRAFAAHAALRHRRRLQTLAVTASAAVLVAGAGAWSVIAPGGGHHASTATHPSSEGHPRGWRVESYDGVELRVPTSWGWGGTPDHVQGRLVQCHARAYSAATSWVELRPPRGGIAVEPYVGRPFPSGETCATPAFTEAAHVWFDSPLPVGSDPQTGVTIKVRGDVSPFNLTVYDTNVGERQTVLDSVREVSTDSNGCPASSPEQNRREAELDPRSVTSLSVCVYYAYDEAPRTSEPGSKEPLYLYYSTSISGRDASLAASAIRAGGPGPRASTDILCVGSAPATIDIVEHAGDDSERYWINPNDCHVLTYNGGAIPHLVRANSVQYWAVDGTVLYSRGLAEGNRLTRFLPPSS